LSQQPVPGIRFAFAKPGAGRSGIPYLALHPMGFSVPRRLRFARCALTAPFHPYRNRADCGGLFSVALSVGKPLDFRPRVPQPNGLELRGIAPFGVRTFLPRLAPKAILHPSKTKLKIAGFRENLKAGLTPPRPKPCRGCNTKSGRN